VPLDCRQDANARQMRSANSGDTADEKDRSRYVGTSFPMCKDPSGGRKLINAKARWTGFSRPSKTEGQTTVCHRHEGRHACDRGHLGKLEIIGPTNRQVCVCAGKPLDRVIRRNSALRHRLLPPCLPGAGTRAARSLAAPSACPVISRQAALPAGSVGPRRYAHRDTAVG
jgi:hypothetical protein